VYKSTDNGKSWQHVGLPESHHIGRIILDPQNPDIVWVAVVGHLYSNNPERGVYKTTDGGKTWKQVLFIADNTGVIDMAINPKRPNILYAAAWERERKAWHFKGAGTKSGIYKSTDGGETWTLLTNGKNGFPTGEGLGRIGLAVFDDGEKSFVYAVLDNQHARPKKEATLKKGLTKDKLRGISKEDFLKLDKKEIAEYLKTNDFPKNILPIKS
jgi:hypothetical protein